MRILVAEDETIIRLDLRALLERAGFEVCAEARDGEEAVALAREHQPDVAIMDVKMPKLDGIEAARRILDERPIPIVMLTAYGQDELVSRAVEAGVFGYLVKPFREQDLLPAIHTARARHEELVALREEAESLAEALAARKAIERAKGLLMQKEGRTRRLRGRGSRPRARRRDRRGRWSQRFPRRRSPASIRWSTPAAPPRPKSRSAPARTTSPTVRATPATRPGRGGEPRAPRRRPNPRPGVARAR